MGLIQVGKYFMMNCSWYAGKLGTRARLFMGNDAGRGSYTLYGGGRSGIRLNRCAIRSEAGVDEPEIET